MSVCEFCLDVFAVEAGDVGDCLALRTYGLTCTGVGAVSESEFVHLCNHCLSTLCCFRTSLWEECKLAYL